MCALPKPSPLSLVALHQETRRPLKAENGCYFRSPLSPHVKLRRPGRLTWWMEVEKSISEDAF